MTHEKMFITEKAWSFYNQRLTSISDEEKLDLQTLNSEFNIHTQTRMSVEQFQQIIDDIKIAEKLANDIEVGKLQKNRDYIITSDNRLAFIDKESHQVKRARLANGAHEFLEELLRSKGLLSSKIQYTQSSSLKIFFQQHQALNIGVTGTVTDREEINAFNPSSSG